jgi:hypothetical protein
MRRFEYSTIAQQTCLRQWCRERTLNSAVPFPSGGLGILLHILRGLYLNGELLAFTQHNPSLVNGDVSSASLCFQFLKSKHAD